MQVFIHTQRNLKTLKKWNKSAEKHTILLTASGCSSLSDMFDAIDSFNRHLCYVIIRYWSIHFPTTGKS